MIIKQLYTNCLSEAAYFIADSGVAAVIDPLRDVEEYIALANEHNAEIKYIFETHFHADFVSGHIELARVTGATIIYGPEAKVKFDAYVAKDKEEFAIGQLSMQVLHTPGHTLESTCYLLTNAAGVAECIFTGDTLFVGDVGRPDLFGGLISKEDLAGMMYDSLQKVILPLQDNVVVYPAHGPGSACGKNLGKETFSTVGEQRASNYALQPQTKEEFIKNVTEGLSAPPAYFSINAKMNAEGYSEAPELKAMTPKALKSLLEKDVILLDTRDSTIFTQGFVPGSISIGLDGRFAEWAGSLLPFDRDIVLIAAPDMVQESAKRLRRVGLDRVVGYLKGGVPAWVKAGFKQDMIIDIEPDELSMDLAHDKNMVVLDVRKQNEYDEGHVKGAQLATLSSLNDPLSIAFIDDDKNLYVHCAGGYRSVIAASLLRRQGYDRIRNVLGGFGAMKSEKAIPTVSTKAAKIEED